MVTTTVTGKERIMKNVVKRGTTTRTTTTTSTTGGGGIKTTAKTTTSGIDTKKTKIPIPTFTTSTTAIPETTTSMNIKSVRSNHNNIIFNDEKSCNNNNKQKVELFVDEERTKNHNINNKEKNIKKSWNDMLHLSIKRFENDSTLLKPGAIRNRIQYPYVACIELDPSGRSLCKHCGLLLPKNTIRCVFMMECHAGYRTPCTVHENCFFQHRELTKLHDFQEIYIHPNVPPDDIHRLREQFETTVQLNRKKNGYMKEEEEEQQEQGSVK